MNFYPTDASHPVFNYPNKVSQLLWNNDLADRDGQIAQATAGSAAIASFEGYPESGSIIINSSKSGIFNAFQSSNFVNDLDADGKTDMVELIENEIFSLIHPSNWLTSNVIRDTIAAGASASVELDFNASKLSKGNYYADVNIKSNDPLSPLVSIPVHLYVNPMSDSMVLVTLYNSTNGPGWTNNTNWLSGPLNTWYGITVADGRVSIIEQINNNLIGYIPSEIGNLTELQYLTIVDNSLMELPFLLK